jgi:hypothetical protein
MAGCFGIINKVMTTFCERCDKLGFDKCHCKKHRTIIFSPFANNVLDYLGKQLQTPSGTEVVVTKPMINFIVKFNGLTVFESSDNLAVSYFLNQREIGQLK